mgnify:FL=1
MFVLIDEAGYGHIFPSASVSLTEVKSGQMIFRTSAGDFRPTNRDDPILELIMSGERSFGVKATSFLVEKQRR